MIPNNHSPEQGELMSDVSKHLTGLCNDFLLIESDFEVARVFFDEIFDPKDETIDPDTVIWIVGTHLTRLKESFDEYKQTVRELQETVKKLK